MDKTAIRYNRNTGIITGIVSVGRPEDLLLNLDKTSEALIVLTGDHPALENPRNWICPDGVLTYDPKPEPLSEPQPRVLDFVAALVDEINVSRQALNLKTLTLAELIDSAKAKMEEGK